MKIVLLDSAGKETVVDDAVELKLVFGGVEVEKGVKAVGVSSAVEGFGYDEGLT